MEQIKETAETYDSPENAFSEGYTKAYNSLISDGWQPRKARRYLDSIAKRNLKKYIKGIKKNEATNTIPCE